MLRILTTSIVLIILTAVLGGCSVFGVATKSELESAMRQEAIAQRETESRLADLSDRLADAREAVGAVERRLQPRLAALDSAMARTEQNVARSTQQWQSVQALLAADMDSVRVELDGVAGEVAAMSRGVASVREGMTLVSARASSAQDQSREALRRQQQALEREREHLLARLQDLESRLATWPALEDSVPAGSGQPRQPAAGTDAAPATGDAGTVEIRPTVTPERDATPPGD